MKYDKVRKNAPQLLSLTGFTIPEFESFLPPFQYEWEEYYSHYTLKGKVRERISYGRKTGLLPMISDKLLFILSYLKNNPLQEYHGATFGMTQPQCNAWIHLLSDILVKTLKTLESLPERNSVRMQRLLQSSEDVLLDGTERPIQRPMDSDRQKSCYSGKKNA
ncbi:MAG: hypothetical protein EZS26_001011 [Candidatus Ordinivivax streblomastigis]|uniref:Transposase Helix-turn-helix domain-containing protein n=1 Tax=Candidatus Ordinivivax streblomastigis TaxID=2540710 RepID=A0A5M8P348_9BACT|nr:MAG: hypothetical protein EZS26_001011 [Candidatus Ordinivivax streblomastigis]